MSDARQNAYAERIIASSAAGRALQGMMAQRRNYVENLVEQSVRNGQLQGFVQLDGSGETDVQILFPMEFLEKPIFTYGHEMAPNQAAQRGAFPIASATVLNWITRKTPGENEVYVGAHVGVVVLGPPEMISILHYSFQGQSFSGPSGNNTTVTGRL